MLEAKKLSKQEEGNAYSAAARTCDNEPKIAIQPCEDQRIQGHANGEDSNIHKVYEICGFRASFKDLHV